MAVAKDTAIATLAHAYGNRAHTAWRVTSSLSSTLRSRRSTAPSQRIGLEHGTRTLDRRRFCARASKDRQHSCVQNSATGCALRKQVGGHASQTAADVAFVTTVGANAVPPVHLGLTAHMETRPSGRLRPDWRYTFTSCLLIWASTLGDAPTQFTAQKMCSCSSSLQTRG
eukprot:5128588-Prymnesium_polylepis.1